MDFDLVTAAMQLSPEDRQLLASQVLRRRMGEESMRLANSQANRFNTLAAVTQMANNEGAAAAAQTAMKSAQAQHKPLSLGSQGFALPSSGEFVASPMYEDEQEANRTLKKTLAQDRIAQQQAAMAQNAQLAQDRIAQQREAAQMRNALGMTMAAIAQQRADQAGAKIAAAPKGKVIPGSEVRQLTERESIAGAMNGLVETFKPEFGGEGSTLLAGAKNALGRMQPLGIGKGYAERANWWQNYAEQANKVRHALFGSALTANEQAAFEKATITEGMHPAEIQRRLGQQAVAATSAYNKLVQNYGRAGYDMSGFNPLTPSAGRPGDKYLENSDAHP